MQKRNKVLAGVLTGALVLSAGPIGPGRHGQL